MQFNVLGASVLVTAAQFSHVRRDRSFNRVEAVVHVSYVEPNGSIATTKVYTNVTAARRKTGQLRLALIHSALCLAAWRSAAAKQSRHQQRRAG
jgi:hypothetical protein